MNNQMTSTEKENSHPNRSKRRGRKHPTGYSSGSVSPVQLKQVDGLFESAQTAKAIKPPNRQCDLTFVPVYEQAASRVSEAGNELESSEAEPIKVRQPSGRQDNPELGHATEDHKLYSLGPATFKPGAANNVTLLNQGGHQLDVSFGLHNSSKRDPNSTASFHKTNGPQKSPFLGQLKGVHEQSKTVDALFAQSSPLPKGDRFIPKRVDSADQEVNEMLLMESSHHTGEDQSVNERSFLNLSADMTPQARAERREEHKANVVASILNAQTQQSKTQQQFTSLTSQVTNPFIRSNPRSKNRNLVSDQSATFGFVPGKLLRFNPSSRLMDKQAPDQEDSMNAFANLAVTNNSLNQTSDFA